MQQPVRKAVFPVAGLGTRFLPATKSIPKEMLPVVDKPIIQYAVEEAVNAGINEIIFVTHPDKSAIEDHFRKAEDLERELTARNRQHLLASINSLLENGISLKSVIQHEPLGLGHAVLCAKDLVGGEPFAVILPDDLIDDNDRGCLQQMVAVHDRLQAAVIAVENIPASATGSYGIVETSAMEPDISRILSIVEKPHPDVAPSTLAVVGRYVLPPVIFEMLEKTTKGAGGEIQLTDAIAMLLENERVLAYEFEGKRYDCGTKLGYLRANISYGIKDTEIGNDFLEFIKSLK